MGIWVAAVFALPTIDRWTCYMLVGDFERAWQESDRIEGGIVWNREDFWRWMRNRSDSPSYPTMKLFRQPAPGDWASVV